MPSIFIPHLLPLFVLGYFLSMSMRLLISGRGFEPHVGRQLLSLFWGSLLSSGGGSCEFPLKLSQCYAKSEEKY
uniref:Uncharacterized protein n=1 Tax=Megaselia scalaris TaxID=36166 RepID=T1GYG2_MEGSC